MTIKLLRQDENEKARYGVASTLVTGEFKSAVTLIETEDGKWKLWMEGDPRSIADLLALGYKEISEIQKPNDLPNQTSRTA